MRQQFFKSQSECQGRPHTFLALSSSSIVSSRWCRRLNLLILSWSSRRTSTSSPTASSSSLLNCRLVGGFCQLYAHVYFFFSSEHLFTYHTPLHLGSQER